MKLVLEVRLQWSSQRKEAAATCVCVDLFGSNRIVTLRVQVPNNRILNQNLYCNYYSPNPKYLVIGYMDPLGNLVTRNPD